MNWKEDRIGSAVKGDNPAVLTRMKSGFAVLADAQFLPGYCILLAYPKVKSLNHLDAVSRLLFLREMSIIGDAILDICRPLRINYEILGNTDAYLHAHIIPRYDWEEDEFSKLPIWMYPEAYRTSPEFEFSEEKHAELKMRLANKLEELIK